MSTRTLSRQDIVEALDELGEREQLASAWVEKSDEAYPPEAVRQRAKRLRWRLQWRRGGFVLLMVLMGATGGLGIAGWAFPGVLSGALFGVGVGAALGSMFTGLLAEKQIRALQLYDLLREIDHSPDETSSAVPAA